MLGWLEFTERMALVAVGRISQKIVYRRPVFLMKQDIVAVFMTSHATFAGRSLGMAADTMGRILAARRPPASMRARLRLRMAGHARILGVAHGTGLPIP